MQDRGIVINTIITLAKGILLATDTNLLIENGVHIDLTKEWAQRLMNRVGLAKHEVSTVVKVDQKF